MIRSISGNNTQIYHLSAGKSLPDFLKDAGKGKSLRKDKEFQRRLELIQDFELPISVGKVCISPDGQFVGAVGCYPPELKIYDTAQLSLKCSRGFDSEVIDFQFISDDYRKLVFLQTDRSLEFHAQGGRHHRLRVPKMGRSLRYIERSAELLVVGSSSEIYRLDLDTGSFLAPINSSFDEVNCCTSCASLPAVFVGGSNGMVEVFDSRCWKPVRNLQVVNEAEDFLDNGRDVTALDISENGMLLAAGTASGVCRVYDIRSSKPLAVRDHKNLLPIVDVKLIACKDELDPTATEGAVRMATADKRSVKLWEFKQGSSDTKAIGSLEPEVSGEGNNKSGKVSGCINSIAVYPKSGLIFVAQDNPRVGVYFIPKLGNAPKWCSFLDLLTEELEEKTDSAVYEDFQFVTKLQLEEIGASHLIGTPLLRAYMHGYFMDFKLYHKLKAAAAPFDIEEYHKKKVQQKIDTHRKMRIQIKRKLPNVNKELASKLQEAAEFENRQGTAAKAVLSDDRFSQLFTNPEFAVESLTVTSSKASKRT